jgi:hypothetical protein
MDEEMVAQQRAQRAQAAQQAMQAEQLEQTASALGKAGAVRNDSMIAQAMGAQMAE